MSEAVQGVVFAHSAMAEGIVGAVRAITGISADALVPVSNDEGSPEVLADRLAELCGTGATVVFTDLVGSSCNTLAAVLTRGDIQRRVVSGVNLPMLIEFTFNRHQPIDLLVERVVLQGRQGIQAQGKGA